MAATTAGFVLAVLGIVGFATPAFAHAQLDFTTPVDGAVLSSSPGQVTMSFGEGVEIQPGSVRVFDSQGHRIDVGNPYHPDHNPVAVGERVPAGLPAGGYIVTWRVISADSHPVHGAFTFQIGSTASAGATKAEAAQLFSSQRGDSAVGVLYGIDRAVGFAALAVLVGGSALTAGAWLEGAADWRVRRLLWVSWWTAIATTALTIYLQGPYGAGLGLTAGWRPSVLDVVLRGRLGMVYMARLIVLLLAGLLLRVLIHTGWRRGWSGPDPGAIDDPAAIAGDTGELAEDRLLESVGARSGTTILRADPVPAVAAEDERLPYWWMPYAVVAGLAIVVSPGLADHASTGSLAPLAVVADLVHVAGASVWIGGLAILAAVGLARTDLPQGGRGRRDVLHDVLPRFSTWAVASVIALVVSGGFAAWREVGSWSAVTTTTYGRLLLAKTIIFAGLVAIGASSRRVTRHAQAPSQAAAANRFRSTLRRTTSAELAFAAVIFTITALLVNAQPARQSINRSYTAEVRAGPVLVDLTLDKSRPGPNALHLYTLDRSGSQLPVPEIHATLSLPKRGISGLPVKLEITGRGHFESFDLNLPAPGTWRLDIQVRTDAIDEYNATPAVIHIN